MSRTITILLMMFNLSCQTPKIDPVVRCAVSFQFKKCRCHNYDLMNQKRISEAWDEPLDVCDDIVGFFAEDWAEEITPWMKEVRRFGEDRCR